MTTLFVHAQDQFTFIHDAILESVTCGDTQIAATNLRMSIVKMKKKDNQNQPHGFLYQFKVHIGIDIACLQRRLNMIMCAQKTGVLPHI